MFTLDYFKNEIANLGLPVPSDSELSQIIRTFSTPVSVFSGDIISIDAQNKEFKLPYSLILDNSFIGYRTNGSSSEIFDISNLLPVAIPYDVGTMGIPGGPLSVDHATGHVYLDPAYPNPIPNPYDDLVGFRYSYTNYDSVIDRVMFTASIQDRRTSERRGNVTIEKKSLYDVAIGYRKLKGVVNEGLEVGEINFTRLSHGEVYGADPDTGQVLP